MRTIKLEDDAFPSQLRNIDNAPKKLYIEGNLDNLYTNCISVIGSRCCTEYGEKWCEIFVRELVKYGITIVSGMAIGIDAVAHNAALKAGGKTIAVLPCGLKNIYPKQNINIYQNILKSGGTVISEYSPKTTAGYNKYLERNRIVSGLSIATLVVEAAHRSGTTVTARFAKEQGRDVYCIPGSLDNLKSIGTNNLIKEGAKIAVTPEDIIINYAFLHKVNELDNKIEVEDDIKYEYKEIYNAIKKEAMDLNDIANQTKLTLREVISKLTMLELEGKVKKIAGNKYKKL